MKILDLLRMSSGSLWKRKFRTILTILGVVIGTASIVVMISLGLGLNRSQMETIERYGGLTTIEVREGTGETTYSGGGGVMVVSSGSSSSSSKDRVMRLNDDAVASLSALEHVKAVYPVLRVYVLARYGSYINDYINDAGRFGESEH